MGPQPEHVPGYVDGPWTATHSALDRRRAEQPGVLLTTFFPSHPSFLGFLSSLGSSCSLHPVISIVTAHGPHNRLSLAGSIPFYYLLIA